MRNSNDDIKNWMKLSFAYGQINGKKHQEGKRSASCSIQEPIQATKNHETENAKISQIVNQKIIVKPNEPQCQPYKNSLDDEEDEKKGYRLIQTGNNDEQNKANDFHDNKYEVPEEYQQIQEEDKNNNEKENSDSKHPVEEEVKVIQIKKKDKEKIQTQANNHPINKEKKELEKLKVINNEIGENQKQADNSLNSEKELLNKYQSISKEDIKDPNIHANNAPQGNVEEDVKLLQIRQEENKTTKNQPNNNPTNNVEEVQRINEEYPTECGVSNLSELNPDSQ